MGKIKNKTEEQPKPVLFEVEVIYKSGRVSNFENVLSTVTDHEGSYDSEKKEHIDAAIPYHNYMIIQQADGNSTYVNMEEVEELTVERQNG